MVPSFIYLSGCGHTGSSIIARVIGEHSKIFFVPLESGMFLANRYFKAFELSQEFKRKAEENDASYILEKTPRHVWHIDYIRRQNSSSRFIITTRDGREVIASLYERTGDFEGACRRYFDDSVMSLRQLNMNDTKLIQLEEFSKSPINVLTEVYSWLGLSLEEDVLQFHEKPILWNIDPSSNLESGQNKHDLKRNAQVNSKLEPVVSKWRSRLPEHFHADIIELFSENGLGYKIMKEFGYDL